LRPDGRACGCGRGADDVRECAGELLHSVSRG
jgi:hypothetical protein